MGYNLQTRRQHPNLCIQCPKDIWITVIILLCNQDNSIIFVLIHKLLQRVLDKLQVMRTEGMVIAEIQPFNLERANLQPMNE
jgi:hypothetical protein